MARLLWVALLCLVAGWARADETLFDRLGQREGVARIAVRAVAIWQADERVKADFAETNPARLAERLTDQLCQLTGGPCVYKGRPMRESHAALHVDERRFNAVAEDLQTAMEAEGVPYRVQNRVLALLAPMHRDIVER